MKKSVVLGILVLSGFQLAYSVPVTTDGLDTYYESIIYYSVPVSWNIGMWDDARAYAQSLTYTNDENVVYYGDLVTITSTNEYNFIKSDVLNEWRSWTIGHIGATVSDGEAVWINGEGAVDDSIFPAYTLSTSAATLGIGDSKYEYGLLGRTSSDEADRLVVEYTAAIPEPSTLGFVGISALCLLMLRRFHLTC